ncbi:MAG TPA: ATP-binding protein [Desulfotignum sp.]|nr:ATP-binding protein [Desulfotignum sp.]
MDIRFAPHNLHLESPDQFFSLDPHLQVLNRQPLVWEFPLILRLPVQLPGIYTVSGGRQVGKTTLLKQWMAHLLKSGVHPYAIAFFSGELIDDQHALVRMIGDHLQPAGPAQMRFVILDEVTYIRGWDKGVKYLADSGALEDVVLVLSGSDMVIIREARMCFPGRRGMADQVDFQVFPLGFSEVVSLTRTLTAAEHETLMAPVPQVDAGVMARLFAAFDNFLIHGGFLTAINALARENHIPPAIFAVYSDWIRGDMIKRNKQEHYLRQVLQAVLKRMGSQVTWNALCQDLAIDHPQTVADYIGLLESMDVVYVQPALQEDKLMAAPKKARKVMFTDPFILHAVHAWLNPAKDPFTEQLRPFLDNPEKCGKLVEACVAGHYRRRFPTYYIKAKGEVDVAYVDGQVFHPIEIKWTGQLRPGDLKQIGKYTNSLILTKTRTPGKIQQTATEPVPLHLFRLGPDQP